MFARHWAETQLDGKMAMLVEKARCDMGIAAEGDAGAIVGLKYNDESVPIIENELKMVNANEVDTRGPKNAKRCISLGPRIWCANSSIVDACDKKQCVWLVADAQWCAVWTQNRFGRA